MKPAVRYSAPHDEPYTSSRQYAEISNRTDFARRGRNREVAGFALPKRRIVCTSGIFFAQQIHRRVASGHRFGRATGEGMAAGLRPSASIQPDRNGLARLCCLREQARLGSGEPLAETQIDTRRRLRFEPAFNRRTDSHAGGGPSLRSGSPF